MKAVIVKIVRNNGKCDVIVSIGNVKDLRKWNNYCGSKKGTKELLGVSNGHCPLLLQRHKLHTKLVNNWHHIISMWRVAADWSRHPPYVWRICVLEGLLRWSSEGKVIMWFCVTFNKLCNIRMNAVKCNLILGQVSHYDWVLKRTACLHVVPSDLIWCFRLTGHPLGWHLLLRQVTC